MSAYTEDEYLDYFSKNLEEDGDLELDTNPEHENVSVGESDGAYVLCWKWVDDADIEAQ